MATPATENIYLNMYRDTTHRLSGVKHILFMWQGSIYKLLVYDFLIFCSLYATMALVYRLLLVRFENESMQAAKELFEMLCIYSKKSAQLIPISFLTGFYVTQVVTRWWDQFMSLPWPDKIALRLVSYVPGKDNFRKNLRRTVMRYLNLSTILVYRLVSDKVKNRFPTYKEMEEAKLILPHEIERLERADNKTPHESTWAPILWAVKLLQRARTEGKVTIEAPIFANLISSFDSVEEGNRKILNYGWVNFPLAYTQVATVSVYVYFLAAIFGRQFLLPKEQNRDIDTFPSNITAYSNEPPFDEHTPDFVVPFFSFIEFLCYVGWIKVAETLLNPFGDDDEDFQVNYIIDRNLQVSYLIVDEAEEALEMAEDPFLEAGISIPTDLPSYVNKSSKAPLIIGQMSVDQKDSMSTTGSINTAAIVSGESKSKNIFLRRLTSMGTSTAVANGTSTAGSGTRSFPKSPLSGSNVNVEAGYFNNAFRTEEQQTTPGKKVNINEEKEEEDTFYMSMQEEKADSTISATTNSEEEIMKEVEKDEK